ncbi:natalisin isoform X2 [Anticarsia gemmatalis]|uniref:natalisin isoform X2 n=1 Tax=Anticarsia gemmatalis TaxID=129554 RepID=UPI003F767F4C
MRNKIQTFLLFLLIISTDVVIGKSNKTKLIKASHKKHNSLKDKPENERMKRSLNDDDDRPFWPNRGKKQIDDVPGHGSKYNNDMEYNQKVLKSSDKLVKDQPFWGNRGRRDGPDNFFEYEYPEYLLKHCEHCVDYSSKSDDFKSIKDRREDFISPFWGSRGRRNSLEAEDSSDPFWGNRGRRQEKEPFWGNRGRRTENEPFWGNRGRRDDEPFWGNRGRRDSVEPFWGNRGRRDDSEPFWGNRGRRQENEPFWGNRGRRDEEPFWGNRGRRKDSERNWVRNRKEDLKDSILSAINDVENDIENLSRLKKNVDQSSFWANRGRDNKLTLLFNGPSRPRGFLVKPTRAFHGQAPEPGTVLDNRILEQAARDRRGAIEEIVKSVRNDPYYIARGKKDIRTGNATVKEEYIKAKELICAAIDLIMIKNDVGKVKREIPDTERDRRTILKKLAAQLQMDPYFVSRGKKNDDTEKDYLQEFISNVAEKCN